MTAIRQAKSAAMFASIPPMDDLCGSYVFNSDIVETSYIFFFVKIIKKANNMCIFNGFELISE